MEMDVIVVNVIVKNKSTTIFHGLTFMTSRCSKLCSETTHLWFLVPLEF